MNKEKQYILNVVSNIIVMYYKKKKIIHETLYIITKCKNELTLNIIL